MVLRNGYTEKDKSGQGNIFVRLLVLFVKFFMDVGLEDAESRLVLELVSITEKDELMWEVCDENIVAFEASRNDIPFRLEIDHNVPILLIQHGDIKSRIIKGGILNVLVQMVFKQEAKIHRRAEIRNFDPDDEFKRKLLDAYNKYVKRFTEDRP